MYAMSSVDFIYELNVIFGRIADIFNINTESSMTTHNIVLKNSQKKSQGRIKFDKFSVLLKEDS